MSAATRQKPIARMWVGFGTLRLYEGRLTYHGEEYSLRRAHARVQTSGWRNQKLVLIVEGPDVALVVRILSSSQAVRLQTYRFVAQLNASAKRTS